MVAIANADVSAEQVVRRNARALLADAELASTEPATTSPEGCGGPGVTLPRACREGNRSTTKPAYSYVSAIRGSLIDKGGGQTQARDMLRNVILSPRLWPSLRHHVAHPAERVEVWRTIESLSSGSEGTDIPYVVPPCRVLWARHVPGSQLLVLYSLRESITVCGVTREAHERRRWRLAS